jgi:hypothetical protein
VTVPVVYLDSEPSGLAAMLGGIIEGNLLHHPERERLLAPTTVYAFDVPDVEVQVSLRLTPERVQVKGGIVGRPHLIVRAESEALLGLSTVPMRFGMPDPLTKDGRAVVGDLLGRRVRIKGMLGHPLRTARWNKLLSVE